MKHLFTFRQRPNESLTGKLARVSSDTLSQVSAKCRSTVGRLSTLFLLLALSFGFSSQAWADYTWKTNDLLYYDFSAYTGSGGINWHNGNDMQYDGSGAGKIKKVKFSKNVTMNNNWVIVKTEQGGWDTDPIKFTNPPSANQRWFKISADGKSGSWKYMNKYLACDWGSNTWSTTAIPFTNNQNGTYTITTISLTANTTYKFKIVNYDVWDGAVGHSDNVKIKNGTLKSTTSGENIEFQSTHSGAVVITYDGTNININCPYQVTYKPGTNGTGSQTTSSVTTYGTALTLSDKIFNRTGYVQTGWAKTDGGAKAYDLKGSYTDYVDQDLYPVWTEVKHTITVQSNNADYGTVASSSVSAGQITAVALPTATVKSSAYKFVNWTATDGITITNPNSATDATITATKVGIVTANFALAATYDLTLQAGTGITAVSGGKSGQGSVPFDGGTISATMANGYDFDKWTADPAANAEFADANSATTTVTVKNGSVTVTANAKAKSYNINYPSGTGYSISNNPATGATDETITFTVTPATNYSVVVKQDGNTLTKGGSNQYSFTMPAHDATITVEAEYQSGWYLAGNSFGNDYEATNVKYPLNHNYRNLTGYFYREVSEIEGYFLLHDGTTRYAVKNGTITKGNNFVNLETTTYQSMQVAAKYTNVWVVADVSGTTKKLKIQDPATYYTVSVEGAGAHGSYTLKDKTLSVTTNQYSANDTYVLTITTTDAYLPSLTVNGSPVSWKSSTTTTYTYEGKATAATTLAVSYVPHFQVTFGYATDCSSTQGTYTVKNGSASVTSGSYIINGTELTFAAEAKPGYQFDGWYTSASAIGEPESTETTYKKTINATTALYAKFSKKIWNVTVAADGTGTGTLDPVADTYQVNQVDGRSFTATPAKGSWFAIWTITAGAGSWTGTTFKPTANSTITATFTKYTSSLPMYASYHAGLITVTPNLDTHYPNTFTLCYELYKGDDKQDVEFDFGDATNGTVTFPVAVAGTDYTLKAIVHGGSDCNATIIDEFEQRFTVVGIYTVNFAVSPTDKGCTVTPAPSKNDVELNIPFAISASEGTNTGYHFNKWVAEPAESFTFGTEAGDATKASTTATMTVATATSTITATFSPNTYSVHFNANCAEDKQQATGTMEDQSFEYDDAAKALTANAFVRLGYTFLGWSENASATEATYTDKAAVQNLTTVNGGKVQLYAIWDLKTDCSITVTIPDAADGTIDPSAKVENESVEGGVHEYTFIPASDAVTFMNWTITNAICVEGTNERSNPVKIKTYGEATIRANVKENLVSVTLKVVPNDQWGYFNVNGKNVASGTIINVGAKTTAEVNKYANYGYKFDRFEYSDDYANIIDYNEESGHLTNHNGATGKATIIAHFTEDKETGWYLGGSWDNWSYNNKFQKHGGETKKAIAYCKINMNKGTTYQFKIRRGTDQQLGNFGNGNGSNYMNDNYHFGWTFSSTGGNVNFYCNTQGTHVFVLDYSDENNPKVSILYPDQYIPDNTTIYFNNYHNAVNWPNPKFRLGVPGGMAEAYSMTLVPGTANLYSYTFVNGWYDYNKFHICDNWGWTGYKDHSDNTQYGIYNIGEGDYKIKHSTAHYGGISTTQQSDGHYDYVIQPYEYDHDGDYDVKYYNTHNFSTLAASRYTVKFTAPTNGTLTVEQWDNNEGSARTTLNSGAKVDQSRWITITATPATGYKFVKMTAKMEGHAPEDHYETTWKYAVVHNVTSITATFAPVVTNTFYVKNATETEWQTGINDVYVYYWKGDVSNWGWPGIMATPMDNDKTWYKVEINNAYFDLAGWKLDNGAGANCPQTKDYEYSNLASMQDKYYEIHKNGSTYNTYELRAASSVPDFYRVITADGKYTSNVATVGETVSFFATTDGAKLQKSSAGGWTDVAGGSISIDKDTVWVATVDATGVSDLDYYSGKYYIRTDGADGGWNNYKQAGKNNTMTHFTKRTGETYSYYWVDNLGKEAAINVKAKIANDYNDNLAVEITNDANTNIYGNIEKLTNGSNVRFSYEPATNEFKRAILSGSAEASYLNIVADNIYSDVSCKAAFELDENMYKTNPSACKLNDISDWVYEKIVYAQVPDDHTNVTIDMYSMYNGNRSTLLDDKIIMVSGTNAGVYKLRVIYDFKKNRITTAWSPSSQEIANDITVNSDIMFMQVEKGDVSQITLSQSNNPNVKSLEYLLYVLEIEDPGEGKRKEEHYRISLPFNCRVSDIFGIEGYMDKWGIQKYNGELRAEQGWYTDSPVQNFWTWLKEDEIMEAGRGYSVSIDKRALSWSSIGEEVTRTVCDAQGMNCQDVTTMEDRASHRLYFPSMNPGFDLKNSTAEPEKYPEIKCNKTKANRDIYDSDWRFIGTKAYNNIKTTEVDNKHACELAPRYIWVLNQAETEYITIDTEKDFLYHSFGAYMLQFHGTIEWNIYTQSADEQKLTPHKKATEETKVASMRLDLMEEDEQQAYAFVDLNEYGTLGFDQKRDLTNLPSSKLARLATVADNVEYSGNCLPYESQIVPVTVATLHKGDYTFTAGIKPNVAVYLIDYQEKTEIDLQTTNYTVELPKGKTADRFALRFDIERTIATDLQSGKGNMNDAQTGLYKFIQNDHLYIMRDGKLYDGAGTSVK
ncbi:MAG: InlB B-repeat-containing protein [Bacteroidales bacterium]|nr:InlB B-repeat-containing protein [Bacteroidales bacterium]